MKRFDWPQYLAGLNMLRDALRRAGQLSYQGRLVMQADRQIQGSPVVLEAGGRERRPAEQGFYIV